MGVYHAWQRLGSWEIRLDPDRTPGRIREGIGYWDHIVIVAGGVAAPDGFGDALLEQALWAGPVRTRRVSDDELSFAGPGMAVWLGDEDGKGAVLETAVVFDAEPFEDVIAGLLPDAVEPGAIEAVGVDLTVTAQYVDPRTAIDYVCGVADAYWRVNPDGTLDAGTRTHLGLVVDPETVIVPRRLLSPGSDPSGWVVAGGGDVEGDHADYTTRVLLLGQDDPAAGTFVTGIASAGSVPYVDLHGNPVQRTRIVSETITSSTNAAARAQLQLNRFANGRRQVRLSADEYDLGGRYRPGDAVWVYDPAAGIVDPGNVVETRGRVVTPAEMTVQAVDWPITADLRVLWRSGAGVWTDLTPFMVWETGQVSIEVGELPRTLTGRDGISVRVASVDGTIPGVPGGLAVSGQAYQPGDGSTRTRLRATWTQPANTDATAVTDGGWYELRYQRTGDTAYQYQQVPWGVLTGDLLDLPAGESYDVAVRAVDRFGNAGAWSTPVTATTPTDPNAPGKPSTPTAAASELRLQITHPLTLAAGGALPDDMDHLEIHVDTSSGFTPSAGTLAGKAPANAAMIAAGVSAIVTVNRSTAATCYVKVIAVDATGNRSPASDAVAASANLIDTANISDAAITNAKIGNAEITGAKIATATITDANIATATITSAKIASLDAGKITTGTLSADRIAAGTINADRIVANSITTTQIGAGAVSTDELAAGAVTTVKIGDAQVTNAKIGSIDAGKITTGTLSASTLITIASGGYIQSSGYSAGSAGFRISGSGSAEFNNVTVRGTFISTMVSSAQVEITGGYVRWVNPLGTSKILSVGSGIVGIYNDGLTTRVNVGYNGAAVFGLNGATYYGLTQTTSYTDLKSTTESRIYAGGGLMARFSNGLNMVYMPDSAFFTANVSVQTPNYDLYRVTSSGRNKADLVRLDQSIASARLRELRPTSYKSTIPADHARYGPDHRANGFIAEELAAVAPSLVHWERPVVWLEEPGDRMIDDDGNEIPTVVRRPVEDPDAPLAPISPNVFAILAELVAAWQELDGRVTAVEQSDRRG